jgi:DNA polymerase elongation subunit (family B)
MMKGWLLDAYPDYEENRIRLWFKGEDGDVFQRSEEYTPYFYLSSTEDYSDLIQRLALEEKVLEAKEKDGRNLEGNVIRVIKVRIADFTAYHDLADRLMKQGKFYAHKLYQVDIPFTQRFLSEKGIFSSSWIEINDGEYKSIEDIDSLEYDLPQLSSVFLEVESEDGLYTMDSPIKAVKVRGEEEISLENLGEEDILVGLSETINAIDPDILYTARGDSQIFPYLMHRASENGLEDFSLGREPGAHGTEVERSYFSYGRVYFKPASYMLKGRVHIDTMHSFLHREGGLEGLLELSRISSIPLQRISRVTPGNVITSIQLKYALENDILIPWKRQNPESFKTAADLARADRGGFIFEPKVGLHESVVEYDFASMFPSIMRKYNISPETVLCSCCPDSLNKVPELGYNICARRMGIIPRVIGPIIDRRYAIKRALRRGMNSSLKNRQNVLKWILLTSFGYMGYRNARFGRIECHESITAYGRELLLEAASMAERRGFEVLHGIVDSLWLKKDVGIEEFVSLGRLITRELGIPLDIEGRYKWIVFLPSKHKRIGVMNRYYGLFEDDKLKVRGIEIRRGDIPRIVKKAQLEMLNTLKKAEDASGFRERIPSAIKVLGDHVDRLMHGEVDLDDLVLTVRISMRPEQYRAKTLTHAAMSHLADRGIKIHPGEYVRYIIRDQGARKIRDRVILADFFKEGEKYDALAYAELLFRSGETILLPFGYSSENLKKMLTERTRQTILM